jgi:archaeosortase B (VPXXXP-CTERM-specific)
MAGRARSSSSTAGSSALPAFSAFALRLLLYLFAVSLLFSLGGLHQRLGLLQNAMASVVVAGANLFGANASGAGSIIRLATSALDINHECTGIFVLLVYGTFVAAYPASWSQRASGIGIGVVVLMTINIARLIVLTVIASRYPDWFAYFHEYFFQGVFIALLAFLASIWTEQVRRAALNRVPG